MKKRNEMRETLSVQGWLDNFSNIEISAYKREPITLEIAKGIEINSPATMIGDMYEVVREYDEVYEDYGAPIAKKTINNNFGGLIDIINIFEKLGIIKKENDKIVPIDPEKDLRNVEPFRNKKTALVQIFFKWIDGNKILEQYSTEIVQ